MSVFRQGSNFSMGILRGEEGRVVGGEMRDSRMGRRGGNEDKL